MAKFSIKAGSTSQSVNLFVSDSSVTTGAGLAGIAPAGGSLLTGTKFYYTFAGANAASVVQSLSVLAAVNSAFSAGGIVQIDNTNMVGTVRVDLPDAMLAGSKGNTVMGLLFGGTNMAPCPFEIELTGWDNQDAVHGGLSALPNAAASAAGGLLTFGTGSGQVNPSSGAVTTTYTIKKNTAFNNFEFQMVLASDHVSPAPGLTVTCERSIDGGAYAACANAATSISAGTYKINLAATDLNGNMITFKFSAATADTSYIAIVTQTP